MSNPRHASCSLFATGQGFRLCLGVVLWVLLIPATQAERTVRLQGTLLNQVNWTGHYPKGAALHLELRYNELQRDSLPLNLRQSNFDGALNQAVLTVETAGGSPGFSRSAKVGPQSLRINLDAGFGEPVITSSFYVGEASAPDALSLEVRWYGKLQGSAVDDTLTQDLSSSRFRFVEIRLKENAVPGVSSATLAGVAWDRHPPDGTGAASPLRKTGYREMFVFGDSLSASTNPDASAANAKSYFENGYCNGPVWVQHLAWRLGIPYREENNLSKFGSFKTISPAIFEGRAIADSLAINWVNTEVYQTIILLALGGRSLEDGTPESAELDVSSQLELLHTAELVDAVGVRDLLILGAADIGFAPGLKLFLNTPESRTKLRAFVNASNQRRRLIVADLPELFPRLRTRFLDPNTYLDRLKASPRDYGISNLEVGAIDGDPAAGIPPVTDQRFDGPGANYFFWNGLAPTTKVHCYLADAVYTDVFHRGTAAESEPTLRVIRTGANTTRLYAWNLSPKSLVAVEHTTDLTHWSVADEAVVNEPCRIFDLAHATGEVARLYRLTGE